MLNTHFFRFLLVGSSSGIVQFFVLFITFQVFSFSYQAASIMAYVWSVLVHYTLNRIFTFKRKGRPPIGEIWRYLIMIGGNALITLYVTMLSVEVLQLGVYVGTILSILMTVGLTFLMSKYWVFRKTIMNE